MAQTPFYFRSFEKGVVSHLPATKLVDTASPRALNTAFKALDGGTMTVGRRPGYTLTATLPGSRVCAAQAWFHYTIDGATTVHHIVVASDGTLWTIEAGVAIQLTIPTGTGEFTTATVGTPADGCRFVQLNNTLCGFLFNGTHFKIYRVPASTTLYVGTVGLPAPVAPTFNATVAGDMTGTIEFKLTYYNSRTGTESNLSESLERSCTSEAITINLPGTGPTEVDKINVYVRKQELQTKFRRSAAMQLPIATATTQIDFTDDELNQLTISAPSSTTSNSRPEASIRDATIHLSRCFYSDGARLYYSQPGNPEQYDPLSVELVNPEDGQLILNVLTLADETLGVWKERGVHGMTGQTPASWNWDQLIPEIGSISTESLCEGDGQLGWWSEQGPVVWSKSGPPQVLSDAIVKPLVKAGTIYLNRRNHCRAGFDPIGHRFLFMLDNATAASPWAIIPWSTSQGAWEASLWDIGPLASLALGHSTSNEMRLFFSLVGGDDIYEMSSRFLRDNAAEASASAYANVVSGNTAAIVIDTAAPSVNAAGSVARLISFDDLQVHRGTYTLVGTTLTWTSASSFEPAAGDLVVFDSAVVEWNSVKSTGGSFENEKRFHKTYADVWTDGDTPILIGTTIDNETVCSTAWQTTIARNNTDQPRLGPTLTDKTTSHKRSLGRRGRWIKLTFLGWYPLTDWQLSMIGYTTSYEGDAE